MKHLAKIALTLLGLALLRGPRLGAAPEAEPCQAGAARVDISPSVPIRLSGYGARTQPSEGVEDPIHARALAMPRCRSAPTSSARVAR